jgi:hypothetical protein
MSCLTSLKKEPRTLGGWREEAGGEENEARKEIMERHLLLERPALRSRGKLPSSLSALGDRRFDAWR